MIGFFDSGFGGLQTMKEFRRLYPEYSYIFLADTKNCPYGQKTGEEIKKLTFNGIHWLFEHGASIVVLACNTAAAYAIRTRQQKYPEKKVLSITIPGIEKILHNKLHAKNIGILATQATILSDIYNDLFFRFGGEGNPGFQFVMAPKLVDIVEKGFQNKTEIKETIHEYMHKFKDIDQLILGCTHFPVLKEEFKKQFSGEIIDPSLEAAKKFGPYIKRHPEIEKTLEKGGEIHCFTTGNTETFHTIGTRIFEERIIAKYTEIKNVNL